MATIKCDNRECRHCNNDGDNSKCMLSEIELMWDDDNETSYAAILCQSFQYADPEYCEVCLGVDKKRTLHKERYLCDECIKREEILDDEV